MKEQRISQLAVLGAKLNAKFDEALEIEVRKSLDRYWLLINYPGDSYNFELADRITEFLYTELIDDIPDWIIIPHPEGRDSKKAIPDESEKVESFDAEDSFNFLSDKIDERYSDVFETLS